MVPTANNHTPTPEPTGDLEQLFRQKLGEAEVAPRLHLWEQIDHELLVQQNETFRRRLVWHRWVAAACILLFVGAGSWLFVRQPNSGAPLAGTVATAPSGPQNASASASAVADATNPASDLYLGETAANSLAAMVAQPTETTLGYGSSAVLGTAGAAGSTAAMTNAEPAARSLGASGPAAGYYGSASGLSFDGGSAAMSAGSFYDRVVSTSGNSAAGTTAWLAALSSHKVALPGLTGGSRPDTLKPSLPAAPATAAVQLPAELREETTPETVPARPKRWRLMGGYAASAYNPNMTFAASPTTVAYANSVGGAVAARAVNVYEQAADEYRQNLRPGFAQRVAFTASYAASKHLTVSTGVALAEQRATSQTSYYFLDGKMPALEAITASKEPTTSSLAPPQAVRLRTAQYRYRTAGIPVSVRYGSAKPGWSLYAKVGAAVNVLFNTHSELEGVPEAATTYTLKSSNSPYRKVQSSVNSGAGVRFQPRAAQWSVAVGPTAEAGLTTLNTDAVRSSYQARPYAVGMEASVEFGGKAAAVVR